jgi:hypothetical protein
MLVPSLIQIHCFLVANSLAIIAERYLLTGWSASGTLLLLHFTSGYNQPTLRLMARVTTSHMIHILARLSPTTSASVPSCH